MSSLQILTLIIVLLVTCPVSAIAQGVPPYPNAVTDRMVHPETPMPPPAVNTQFTDRDFGSQMVRATDETTDFKHPGSYLRNEASGQANMWSMDDRKFYAIGEGGGVFAFGFDPTAMAITSLPHANPGQPLQLPLRPGPSFSFVDPDLIYGTIGRSRLTISSYRFSTATTTPIIDTTTCGTVPALGSSPPVVSDDDVTVSAGDTRLSISEGGTQSGNHMFVIVFDKNLGCRWYNTQTGQIGGQWGPSGTASIPASYLIRHAYLSRSGQYVKIAVNRFGFYVWDIASLNVTACPIHSSTLACGQYGVVGFNSYVNGAGTVDQMNTLERPLSNLSQIRQLVYPLTPPYWGQVRHFTWSNVDANDSAPVCGSTYTYDGDTTIDEPYAGEIFCIETDGVASTVWRFAHNRAIWIAPLENTQPLGNVSMDGRFFLFTSGWDGQLGTDSKGIPRSDMWIVKLD